MNKPRLLFVFLLGLFTVVLAQGLLVVNAEWVSQNTTDFTRDSAFYTRYESDTRVYAYKYGETYPEYAYINVTDGTDFNLSGAVQWRNEDREDNIYEVVSSLGDTYADGWDDQNNSIGIIINPVISGVGMIRYGLRVRENGTEITVGEWTDGNDWNAHGEWYYWNLTKSGRYVELAIYGDEARTDLKDSWNYTFTDNVKFNVLYWTQSVPASQDPIYYYVDDLALYSEEPVSVTGNVSLESPVDGGSSGLSVDFNYTPTWSSGQQITGAELWTNETGSWGVTAENATSVVNATTNTISYMFPSDALIEWNIRLLSSEDNYTAPSNYTFILNTYGPYNVDFSAGDDRIIYKGENQDFTIQAGSYSGYTKISTIEWKFTISGYTFIFEWNQSTQTWTPTSGPTESITIDSTYLDVSNTENETTTKMRALIGPDMYDSEWLDVYMRTNTTSANSTGWELMSDNYYTFGDRLDDTGSGGHVTPETDEPEPVETNCTLTDTEKTRLMNELKYSDLKELTKRTVAIGLDKKRWNHREPYILYIFIEGYGCEPPGYTVDPLDFDEDGVENKYDSDPWDIKDHRQTLLPERKLLLDRTMYYGKPIISLIILLLLARQVQRNR